MDVMVVTFALTPVNDDYRCDVRRPIATLMPDSRAETATSTLPPDSSYESRHSVLNSLLERVRSSGASPFASHPTAPERSSTL